MNAALEMQAAPSPAANKRVLVVDDALTVRLYCRRLLEDAGFTVVEAVNGLEALEAAMSQPFDLFAVDINMAKMDGYSFLRQARQDPALAGVPALMMSTEGEERDVLKAYEAGANFYLFKPIRPDRFVEAVRLMTGAGVQ